MDNILKKHFDRFMEKGGLPPELRKTELKECKLFDDKDKLETWRNNRKGIRYEDENGNVLCGAVDNILIRNNKLIVLDYKTRGFPLKEDTHEYYQDQMDIYNFLLRKNGYITEEHAYLLFYYPDKINETGEVLFNTELKRIKINIKNGEDIFVKGLKLLEKECPKEKCEWCGGVKNEI